ncbi:MAG TPA: LLM class flavin-dependent oxidoreductase, partial [Stellaceae bacterium]|nr:LLM class flavin-dependent oxidoreductase [Stellaceae bacterium]
EFAVGTDRGRLDVPVNPSSFRNPRPILGRGTLNPAAVADTAARGWPVFTAIKDAASARERMAGYHAALEASGHDAETIRIAKEWSGVGKALHVAETDAEARSEAEAFFAKNPSGAIARNADDMICGSPETVTRKMREFAAAGVGLMTCGFLIDLDNPARLRRSVRLFKERVMPAVAA